MRKSVGMQFSRRKTGENCQNNMITGLIFSILDKLSCSINSAIVSRIDGIPFLSFRLGPKTILLSFGSNNLQAPDPPSPLKKIKNKLVFFAWCLCRYADGVMALDKVVVCIREDHDNLTTLPDGEKEATNTVVSINPKTEEQFVLVGIKGTLLYAINFCKFDC